MKQDVTPISPNVAFPTGLFASVADDMQADCRVNDYDAIAPMFDAIMATDFHAATHAIRESVAASVSRGQTLRCLDLCCGTGLFFERLTERFDLDGLGIDLSAGQLAIAHARPLSGVCRFAQGDVRATGFEAGFDLATINFDALNHLESRTSWRDVLQRACAALRPGGALLVDVNLPDRLVHDWNAPEVIVKDAVVYIQLSRPAVIEDGGVRRQTPIVMFERTRDGLFERHRMLIEQFAIPLEALCTMLRDCGFRDIDILQDSSPHAAGHIFNKHRAFVSARR